MSRPLGSHRSLIQRTLVVAQSLLIVASLVAPAATLAADPSADPGASPAPTVEPTVPPSNEPTAEPTPEPTVEPTVVPSPEPSVEPTAEPTSEPVVEPNVEPSVEPSAMPTTAPSSETTSAPTQAPASSAPVGTPTIASDKADYAPGEWVTLTGSGWHPGETVHIVVNDDAGASWSHVADVIADDDGSIVDEFNLPNWFVAVYSVVATGARSGIATTTFTDGNVQAGTGSGGPTVNLTYTQFSGVGCTGTVTGPTTVSIGAVTSGNLFSQNTGSFRLAVPASAGTSTFDQWTAQSNFSSTANPLCFDAISGNRTFIANYVAAANTAPTAAPKTATTNEGAAVVVTMTATDTGTCQLTFAVSAATNGSLGAITDNACVAGSTNADSATVTFTPNGDFNGSGSFTYTASDGSLTSSPASVTITVNPVNDVPSFSKGANQAVNEDSGAQSVPGWATTIDRGATNESAQAVDFIVSNDNTALFSAQPAVSPAGVLTYVPAANANGSTTVSVKIHDDGGVANGGIDTSAVQTFTITVRPANDTPTSSDSTATVNEDGSVGIDLGALVSDVETGDANLTYSIVSGPAHGSVTGVGSSKTYTPAANFNGSDSFAYSVTDRGDPDNCGAPVVNVCTAALASTTRTVSITVRAVNDQPTSSDSTATVAEDGSVGIDLGALASDIETSDANLTYSIVSGPAHGSVTGVGSSKTYTPAANFNGSDSFTYSVTDRGDPDGCSPVVANVCTTALTSSTRTVSITVTEVNDVPVGIVNAITIDEDAGATVIDVLSNDSRGPADESSQILHVESVGTATHGDVQITSGGADVTYTPAADFNGSDGFTYIVCDNGKTNGVADPKCALVAATVNVTVNAVNNSPVLDPIGDQTVDEETALEFTATASDIDGIDTLTFSLVGAPAGAAIDPDSGAFSWTPTEAQGPDTYTFDVCVTDDGTPALHDCETIKVTVAEVNVAPVLGAIGDKTVDEETALTFSATASDHDVPANALTYSLAGAPSGAAINASTGAFGWTPTEAQGPGTYTFTVKVTDNGTPNLADQETITVTVREVNVAPVLETIDDQTVDEETLLTFTAHASDHDLPANALVFSLDGEPSGATMDASTGVFTWTPTEAQGPDSYTFDVCVTDDGTPGKHDCETIDVTVNEVNVAPVLGAIGNQSTDEEAELTFTASATDDDIPANTLTFRLADGLSGHVPDGAAIDPSSGVFTWTPTEAQGPDTYTLDVCVTDDGTPALDDCETIEITVNEVNVAPILDPIGDQSVDEEAALGFTATASDHDLPANVLTFTLIGAPASAGINATTGAFSWTPSEADGPGTYTFTVKVTDDGTGHLSDEESITVTVREVNVAPILASIGNQTVNEETPLTFTAHASDHDLPANALKFSLTGMIPAGASIDGSTGVFSWTPTEAQGPGSYTFKVKVTDDGAGHLFDDETITVTVNEVNVAPVLGAIGNATIPEMVAYGFTATASDHDFPANTLTFSLVGAPSGAAINPSSGVFSWTPTEAQGPGAYTFTVQATDNGSPAMSDTESITLTVTEVNRAPYLGTMGPKSANEGSVLAFTASATDPDLPLNGLTFSLADGTTGCGLTVDCTVPAGASINASTGAFNWTPPDNGTYRLKVVVTDDGSPSLHDDEEITITVSNVNPTATFNAPSSANEGTSFNLSLTSPSDPSTTDTTAGFHYSITCDETVNPLAGAYATAGTTSTTTCRFGDNGSRTVKARIFDKDGGSTTYTASVAIGNVNPVASNLVVSVDSATGLVTAGFQYSDAGWLDTHTAAFTWSVDGVTTIGVVTPTPGSNVGPGPVTGSVSGAHDLDPGCYTLTVTATITDDDGGSHTITSTATADVYLARFQAPIKDNERNIAKYGNVVPIKVELVRSCAPGGTVTTPILHITVADGNATDMDPDTTPVIVAESVSSADTGTQMRVNGGGYIYNFSTKSLTQGKDYTIRIRVGSTAGTIIAKALLQPKK